MRKVSSAQQCTSVIVFPECWSRRIMTSRLAWDVLWNCLSREEAGGCSERLRRSLCIEDGQKENHEQGWLCTQTCNMYWRRKVVPWGCSIKSRGGWNLQNTPSWNPRELPAPFRIKAEIKPDSPTLFLFYFHQVPTEHLPVLFFLFSWSFTLT